MLCSRTRSTHVVFLLFLVTDVLLSIDSGALPVALPSLTTHFHMSRFGQGSLGALTPAGFAVATTLVGVLLQRHSPRAMLVAGLGLTTACSAAFAAAPTSTVLFISRAGYGVAYAVFFVFVPVWITHFAPEDRATSWISVIQAGAPVGAVVGMACGGIVANADVSWRVTFLAQSVAIAICTVSFWMVPARLIDAGAHLPHVFSPASSPPDIASSTLTDLDLAKPSAKECVVAPSSRPNGDLLEASTSGSSSRISSRTESAPEPAGSLSHDSLKNEYQFSGSSSRKSILSPSLQSSQAPSYQTCPSTEQVVSSDVSMVEATRSSASLDANAVYPSSNGSLGFDRARSTDLVTSNPALKPSKSRWLSEAVIAIASDSRTDANGVDIGPTSPSRRNWADSSNKNLRERPLYRHMAGQSLALEPEALVTVLKPTLWQQLSHLLGNRVYVFASLALGFLTFTVEGIRYWVVLYRTEVFGDDLGKVVAAFTVVSSTAPILGMFMGGGIIDRCGGYRDKEGVARSMRILMHFSLFAGPSAAAMLLGDLGTRSSLRLFAVSTWLLLFFGGAHVAPLTGIMIGVVPVQMRPLSSAVSLLVNHIVGFFFAPFGVGIIANLRGIKLGFQAIVATSAVAIFFGFLGWLVAEDDLRRSKSGKNMSSEKSESNALSLEEDPETNERSLLSS